jgi:hypothetical protein
MILVPLRPQIHCMHVGPQGGGKCTNFAPTFFSDWQFAASTQRAFKKRRPMKMG